jgi:1-acyl-sn-glycerol-3-phosphate acyltransferase
VLPPIPVRDRLLLKAQRHLSYLFFPLVWSAATGWLRGARRLTLADADAVRARFRELVAAEAGPVVVCANHLTLVDSAVLGWALAPLPSYLRHFRRMPWSVPEKTNFSHTLGWRLAMFLGKCVYVTRGGPREEVRRTLGKIAYLLRAGDLVCIFPEGGRSRTGRVDTEGFAYGVGQVVQEVPEASVLCVYLRGRDQDGYSDAPRKGDEVHVEMEMFRPATASTGLRGARDLATQIVHRLAEMEERHFAARR